MNMVLTLENITKYFAAKAILLDVNIKVEQGERIGLVGANGAGKSTLLNIIDGSLEPDMGRRSIPAGLRIGFLRQDGGLDSSRSIQQELRTVFQPLLDAQALLRRLPNLMAQFSDHQDPEYLRLADQYAKALAFFEANDGYHIDVKIQTVLNGMGFAGRDISMSCAKLSGGERTRLALAKLLLQEPDLLMLDEPTNHLDFATLHWLEAYLQAYKKAVIVVSHDRFFLDRICDRIWEIAAVRLRSFRGNYSRYVQLRDAAYQRELREYEAQQQEIAKLSDYVARNKARASTANMAKSREKALERLEVRHAPPPPRRPMRLQFRYELEPSRELLLVENLCARLGKDPTQLANIFSGISFRVQHGERIAIVGPNGVGKSTLLRALVGEVFCVEGRVRWGRNVRIGYFEQGTERVDPFCSVLETMWNADPYRRECDVRKQLAEIGFPDDRPRVLVQTLSGGEMAKLKLSVLMWRNANVLLLDEPTNHLDLPTREALEEALLEFNGTVIMVSHDRYLLSRVATRVIEMQPGRLLEYPGGYPDYAAHRLEHKPPESPCNPPNEQAGEKDRKRAASDSRRHRTHQQRAQQVAAKKRFIEVEQEISDLELQIAQMQESLCTPEVSTDYLAVNRICGELEQLRQKISDLTEEWCDLLELVEQDNPAGYPQEEPVIFSVKGRPEPQDAPQPSKIDLQGQQQHLDDK